MAEEVDRYFIGRWFATERFSASRKERMATGRKAMLRLLQQQLEPALRELGFTGSLPHFRRLGDDTVDLLSVQFDKSGGGFVLELGQVPSYLCSIARAPTRARG